MRLFKVKSGIVENVIVAKDSASPVDFPEYAKLTDDRVSTGWKYDGTNFSRPDLSAERLAEKVELDQERQVIGALATALKTAHNNYASLSVAEKDQIILNLIKYLGLTK